MSLQHILKNSSQSGKEPTASQLANGEIALNYHADGPFLTCKDTTGVVRRIAGAWISATPPSTPTPGEFWLDISVSPAQLKIYKDATDTWVGSWPVATTTTSGIVELATDAETQAGIDSNRAVTPASLQSKLSNSTSTTSSTTIASSTAVKTAKDAADAAQATANAALPKSGGIITGNLEIGTTGSLTFEGSTADGFETQLTVVDPTADRTITLPNVSGTVVTTGDTGTVTSTMIADGTITNTDINASAAIAHSKLASITAGQVLLGNATNVATATALSGDVTVNSSGVTAIGTGVIVNADINASAAIADTKLATISTAGKVSNSATTATSANTVSAIVARDASGNFSAGTITANLTGTASNASAVPWSGVSSKPTTISGYGITDAPTLSGNNALTGANTFTNGTGQIFRQAATQDGILLRGRAGGTGSFSVELVPTTLTASRTLTAPDVSGTIVTTGDTGSVTSAMIATNTIVDADINTSAAIAGTKVAPNFGSQNITTTGTATAGNAVINNGGNISLNNADNTNYYYIQNNGATGSANPHLAFIQGGVGERARLDGSGRLLLGTSSTSAASTLVLQGYNGNTADFSILRVCVGAATPANGGVLGRIAFGDSAHSDGAWVEAYRDGGTWSGSSKPTRLVFSTTADGASSPTERLRVSSTGSVEFRNGSIVIISTAISSGAGNSTLKYNTTTGLVTYDTSSRLVKERIADCPYGIDALKQLKPRKYFRTDDQREEIGFIADEMVEAMPEFVPIGSKSIITKNEADTEQIPLGVNYEKLAAVLTKALQESIDRIEALEAKVAALEGA